MLETDYLVVGAGALGMAFVDSLIEHSDAEVVMVDRRCGPGGHWLDAYSFVQLDQSSRIYGVNSTPLGQGRLDSGSMGVAFAERASGVEICGYYDDVMRHRFLASGRVRFFPMCDYVGEGCFRSLVTGVTTEVRVRCGVVDATYISPGIPATQPAPFAMAEGVRCVPVGGLADLGRPPAGYVIVGAGKTATDAICWLLDRGCAPDDVTWIRPRDSWMLNRAFMQPAQARTLEGIVLHLESMAASMSVEETFERLETHGVMLRTDPSVTPTMMRVATVSEAELEQLRRIDNVIRLGHVERIDADHIVLEHGSVSTTPDHLHVHCAAQGTRRQPTRPIFDDTAITLQIVIRGSTTLSGALLGVVEASGRTTAEKNELCPPIRLPNTPQDWLGAVLAGISTEMGWGNAPDLRDWLDRSRLSLRCGLTETADPTLLAEIQRRFATSARPARARLDLFGRSGRGSDDDRWTPMPLA